MSKVIARSDSDAASGTSALLIVDMINDFDFADGPALARKAATIAPRISALAERVRAARMPVIYCNDNFGRWRSDFRGVLRRCGRAGMPGAAIVKQLTPCTGDYFVLKPRHSAFFQTPLSLMLERLHTRRIVLAGLTGDSCILATAFDAHVREYTACVPRDCIVSISLERSRRALRLMHLNLDTDTRASTRIDTAFLAAATATGR